jgi:hypothetical protein
MTKKRCLTEAEWLSAEDPWRMVLCLRLCKRVRCKVTARKLLLFGCACCYRVWDLLNDEPCREAVRVTEQFAVGSVSRKTYRAISSAVSEPPPAMAIPVPEGTNPWTALAADHATRAVWLLTRREMEVENVATQVWGAVGCTERADQGFPPPALSWRVSPQQPSVSAIEEFRRQCAVLRDLFIPFRKPAAVDPAWLRWNHGTVPRLAQHIYEERRFGDLPILADALEEAGCAEAALLDHCRQPGEHVRGCWAVDLVLGKE